MTACQFVTVNFAAVLLTPPTFTTTDCVPVGIPLGTMKLICRTPTRFGGTPTNKVCAGAPPMVTLVDCAGAGRLERGAVDAGAAPVEICGNTVPYPVTNRVIAWPCDAAA